MKSIGRGKGLLALKDRHRKSAWARRSNSAVRGPSLMEATSDNLLSDRRDSQPLPTSITAKARQVLILSLPKAISGHMGLKKKRLC